MALKIDHVTHTGHVAGYHRIAAISIEAGDGHATVKVQSYADETMRRTMLTVPRIGPTHGGRGPTMQVPAAPLSAKNHNIFFDEATMAALFAAVHAALKTLPEFAGAEDA